jgi:hypothetical protein
MGIQRGLWEGTDHSQRAQKPIYIPQAPWTLHTRHTPTRLGEGLKRLVADLWLTEAHTSPILLSVTWASRAFPVQEVGVLEASRSHYERGGLRGLSGGGRPQGGACDVTNARHTGDIA